MFTRLVLPILVAFTQLSVDAGVHIEQWSLRVTTNRIGVRLGAQETQFKDVTGASGRLKDGTRVSYHEYEALDGIGLSTTIEYHRSPTAARRELERKIRKAERVIQRESKFDAKGRTVGVRVVVMLPSVVPFNAQAVLIWTSGSQLHSVQSSSLQHILEFEKAFHL